LWSELSATVRHTIAWSTSKASHPTGIAPDGTKYQIEFQALWDGKPHGDVRVCGDLSAMPHKTLLGFIPVYVSDVTDSFIMSPDGRFVGEHETRLA